MKHTKKAALMLAVIPVVGALTFIPAEPAHARDEVGEKSRVERVHTEGWKKQDQRAFSRMVKDHGKHRGWFRKNPEAEQWAKDLFSSIQDNNYTKFKDITSDTPLGDSTTKNTFEKLAQASDRIDAGNVKEANTIMNELRDAGYRFKQLFRESLNELFPKTA